MSVRSIRASKSHTSNVEQTKLLEDLLDVFDKHAPYKTMDALEVLTIMAATLVTTHCENRYCAEAVMSRVVNKMDDVIRRELWLDEHPELRKH